MGKRALRDSKAHQELPLDTSLGFMLREVGRAIGRQLATRLEAGDITVPMWFLLRLLADEDGLTQREISKRLSIMEPSAMETLRMMESRGLIVRERSPVDRRKIHIGLSPEGRALLQSVMHIAFEMNDLISQCGTVEELAILRGMLGKLRGILGQRSERDETRGAAEDPIA